MSLIELAYELLVEKKQAVFFKDILDEISKLAGLTDKQVKTKIAQFYTELNIDGRFLAIGENQWGLRVWYPVDQVVEEIVNPASDFSWQSMHGLFGDHRSKLTKRIVNMFTRKRAC